MKKIILVILFLSAYTFSSAQKRGIIPFINKYKKATIYFRDSTKQEGLAKVTYFDNKIKFKKDKKSEKVIYDYMEIDKLTILERKEDVTYQYKIHKHKDFKKPQYPLLEIVTIGKISLFSKEVTHTSSTPGFGSFSLSGGGTPSYSPSMGGFSSSHSSTVYYLSRDNNDEIFYYMDKNILGGKFKKSAGKYFKDCPELVKKIQSKEFKRRHIVGIIEYYNKNCGE